MTTEALVLIAFLGFAGQTVAVVVSSILTRRAAAAAVAAQLGIELARADAARAQVSATNAARALVESAVATGLKIDKIAEVADSTHKIVNSQRTIMLRLVAALSRRIALENPEDAAAQEAATHAEADLRAAEISSPA